MAAWSSICWENNLWAAVSAAFCPPPPAGGGIQTPAPPHGGGCGPQPAGGGTKPPVARAASCRLARALGRVRGRGASGPPSGGRGQPKENHGRAPDRGPPPPRRRAAGGAPAGGGRVRRRRGTDAGQAANPTPRRPQPAAGPPPHGRAPRRGGCGPPHPGGQQRDRTHTLAGPARHLWGRAGHRHGGGPGRRALQRPRQRAGRGAPGRPHTEQGPSLPVVGRRRRQKNAGKLAPRLDSDWTKKNAGRTLCPPRLPLQRIPDIPLFGVVVRNVLDAGQFHMLL